MSPPFLIKMGYACKLSDSGNKKIYLQVCSYCAYTPTMPKPTGYDYCGYRWIFDPSKNYQETTTNYENLYCVTYTGAWALGSNPYEDEYVRYEWIGNAHANRITFKKDILANASTGWTTIIPAGTSYQQTSYTGATNWSFMYW